MIELAQAELARTRAQHADAASQRDGAIAAYEATMAELKRADSMEAARLAKRARDEVDAAELLLESRSGAVAVAEQALREAEQSAKQEREAATRAELARLYNGELPGLLRGFGDEYAKLADLVQAAKDLAKRAGELAACLPESDPPAITADGLRRLVGAWLARTTPAPGPPIDHPGPAFGALVRQLVEFRGTPTELEQLLWLLVDEAIETFGAQSSDWLRPLPLPKWDDHSTAAERIRTAHAELEQLTTGTKQEIAADDAAQ